MRALGSVLEFDLEGVNYNLEEILYFDGVATKNGLVVGEYVDISVSDIVNQELDGQWCAVISKNNTIKIISDFFGFSTLFYTLVDKTLVVSCQFEALVSHRKNKKKNVSLNYAEIYPYFASNNVILSQAYSSRTSCSEVDRLLPGYYLEISDGDFKIKQHTVPNSNESYEELLQKGITKALHNLSNLKRMGYSTIEQSLSGGKDSRCVLSLALKAGLSDYLSIRTNPKFEDGGKVKSKIFDDDFDIALDIVSTLNLKWSQPKNSIAQVISFDDSLASFKHYRAANYFNWNYTKYKTKFIVAERYIELAGGVGDAFRSPWGNYLRKLKRSGEVDAVNSNLEEAARVAFNLLVRKTDQLLDIFNESQELFKNEMMKIGGRDFYDAIDNHYLCHRNRYHFGNHKHSYEMGVLLYYPLAIKEFIYASRKLSYSDRSKGKMNFDIINAIDKNLHSFGYETPFPFEFSTVRNTEKDESKEASYKIDFKQSLVKKAELSKHTYSEKSYNVKLALDKSLDESIRFCKKDPIVKLILEQLKVIEKIKDASQSEKIKIHNKLELIKIVLGEEGATYHLNRF